METKGNERKHAATATAAKPAFRPIATGSARSAVAAFDGEAGTITRPASAQATGKRRRRRKATRAVNGAGTLVKHGKYYHARWYVGGKLISKSLKTEDLDEARKALERLSVPRAGQDERETLRKIQSVMSATLTDVTERMKTVSIAVGELFALFRDAPNRRPVGERTLNVYEGQFNVLRDWIAAHHPNITNARDISQTIADEYAKWRAATKSPNTHNKDLNLFSQTWRLLAGRFGLEYNPWHEDRIARLKLTPNARRNLTRAECRKVLAAATLEEKAMIYLSLTAAFRLGDIIRMKWESIDLKAKWITKQNRKTGKVTSLPIVPNVLKVLTAWKAEQGDSPDGYVFPNMVAKLKDDGDSENISRIFTRLFRRAGIETSVEKDGKKIPVATFHSLRHTFITNLIESGIDPFLVREAAGHSVMATTAGYTHVGESALRKALTKAAK